MTAINDDTLCKNTPFLQGEADERELCATDKVTLRRHLLAKRDSLPAKERKALDRAICERVAALPCFQEATAVLTYVPVGSEIDVRELTREAWKRGVPVGLPVCNREAKTLTFRRARPNVPTVTGAFGIPVPPENAEIVVPDERTACILPALAYDENRVRLGYGGGYYDRFLLGFRGIAVGVVYGANVLETVFAEPHDRPAAILVTEAGIWE